MGQHRPLLSFVFGLFKQTSLHILQQIYVKKCPFRILCQDSNLRPSEHESPPIITRPGLPPFLFFVRRPLSFKGFVGRRLDSSFS